MTVDQFLVVAGAAKTEISGCPHSEGSVETNRNNEDAAEEQCEIADAKQTEARLVC